MSNTLLTVRTTLHVNRWVRQVRLPGHTYRRGGWTLTVTVRGGRLAGAVLAGDDLQQRFTVRVDSSGGASSEETGRIDHLYRPGTPLTRILCEVAAHPDLAAWLTAEHSRDNAV